VKKSYTKANCHTKRRKTMNRFKVLLPVLAAVVLLAGSVAPAFAAPPGPTIVDVAIAVNSEGPFAGQFDTLIAAVLAADPVVLNTLSGNGQFTVFAPTDDAFEDLLEELQVSAEDLLGNEELLTEVLLYHVARGRRDAEDVLASERIRTLQRGFLYRSGELTDLRLFDEQDREANIIVPNVEAANGIIHVIDRVVLP
jgi:uncharacterized surface protein with fasciclin (FAS1) repeats